MAQPVPTEQAAALRELGQAVHRLEAAYRLLRPTLKDPEKLTLRYYRVQGRAGWILTNYRRLLPEDTVYRLQGRLGRPALASPFDEAVPSRRALLRLRQTARELLEAVRPVLARETEGEVWEEPQLRWEL